MHIIFLAHDCNVSFITNEIRFLISSEKISKIWVFTDYPIEDKEIVSNEKCRIFVYGSNPKHMLPIQHLKMLGYELMHHGFWYLRMKKLKEMVYVMRNHIKKAQYITDQKIPREAVLYSFWAGSGAFIIACLKRYGLKNLSLTRLHAFDIYEDGDNKGHIPWRNFVLRSLDKLVTISDHGYRYLTKKYPFALGKTHTFRLGITFQNEPLNVAPLDHCRIVSCSWAGRRKNLKGIFEAMRDEPDTTWTHLGDGEDFEELKVDVGVPSVLRVELPGRFSQAGIRNFYANEQITCFISLSTNEGLPVSMMEAMAFGIPLISSDVGGCSEIVNENNGVLLPVNYTNEDVRRAVKICQEKFSSPEARKKIQEECRNKFDAVKNNSRFIDFLESENEKNLKNKATE